LKSWYFSVLLVTSGRQPENPTQGELEGEHVRALGVQLEQVGGAHGPNVDAVGGLAGQAPVVLAGAGIEVHPGRLKAGALEADGEAAAAREHDQGGQGEGCDREWCVHGAGKGCSGSL
jgi:hypothetical protein